MSFHLNMLWLGLIWFRVSLNKQLKRDNAGHGEATVNKYK